MKQLMISVGMMVAMTSTAFAADMYGVFMVVKGDIKVQNAANVLNPAKVGSRINVGETVVSGPDSRAKIVMSDRNVMNVMPDTKLKIEKYVNDPATGQKNVELNLIDGKVRNNVEQTYDGEKSKFMVKTQSAVAGVRGTQFVTSFDAKTKNTQIVTLKGAVHVNAMVGGKPFGAPVVVTKGQMTSTGSGKPAQAPTNVPKDVLKNIDSGSVAKMSNPPPAGSGSGTSTASASGDSGGSRQPASSNGPAAPSAPAPSMTSTADLATPPPPPEPPVAPPPKAPVTSAPQVPVYRPTGNTQLVIRPH